MNQRDIDLANDMVRLRDLKIEAARLQASIADREQPRTYADEEQLIALRAKADPVYREDGRLGAPEPLVTESPRAFRIRMLDDLKRYHNDWARVSTLDSIREENTLNHVEQQLFEAARKNGKTYGMRDGEMRQVEKNEAGRHTIEHVGGPLAWFGRTFQRPAPRAQLHSPEHYHAVSRNNILARITDRIPGWMRPTVSAPRSTF
jgi:hypothetical protein